MADGFDLAYKGVDELPVFTAVDTAQDYTLVYDSTAKLWKKRAVGDSAGGEVAV